MHTLPPSGDNPPLPRLPDLDAWTPRRETAAFRACVAAELRARGLHPA